ncbi:hypothetical protein [Lewinella sp. 4G2]|uniref:hypothetical protein n=1 Tax=Lewinella sp. 4G2 TaxID=1803372 RepID=UPI0007B46431|nr:hypothetical protein [Lewinella sp. 4G2]OAV44159.1 hypothetical protein A3850_006460 [Lewinella sp. 4G2]
MDLRQQLAIIHSRANADVILEWLEADETRTPLLMDVINDPDPKMAKVRQRACMVLGDLGRKHPNWLLPYHANLLELAATATHPALPRAVTRYFSELPVEQVSEVNQGVLLDLSFRFLADGDVPVAIRVFSMSTLAAFAALYPELKDELRGLIQVELEEGTASPGFRNRGLKVLGGL